MFISCSTIRQMPLFVDEFVPHDRTGLPLEKRHTMNEKDVVVKVLEVYKEHLDAHLKKGTLLVLGSPAFEIVELLFGKKEAKCAVRCAHPSVWNKPTEVSIAYEALQRLQIDRHQSLEEFRTKIAELISTSWAITNAETDVQIARRRGSAVSWGRSERVERQRESTTADWNNLEIREKRIAGQHAANARPEVQKRRQDARAEVVSRPGVIEKMSETAKAIAARPGENQRRSEQRKKDWSNLSPEERRERSRKCQEGKKKKKESMTPEELQERKEKYRKIALNREERKRQERQVKTTATSAGS